MFRNTLISSVLILLAPLIVDAQMHALQQRINEAMRGKNATVGVAVFDFGSRDTFSINAHQRYPMQSVYKFHLALAVLDLVDQGKLSLEQQIPIKKSDLLPNTWSPMRTKYPGGNVSLPLSDLLRYSVSESDNNACDILFRLVGGTQTVQDYMHRSGTTAIAIAATEEEMHRDWDTQFKNWTTPSATIQLMKTFYEGPLISDSSYAFLWRTMLQTTTGKNRIKGLLPAGTQVAHKTGTSDTNKAGITAAINDIGFVTLPDGKLFAIAIFVANSKENNETNERIIAEIAKQVWDELAD